MLRNTLAAALRNLVRNRLYAAINIIGLAVGIAAALLIALFVRDEFSYDKWIAGGDKTYLVSGTFISPGRAPMYSDQTSAQFAAWMKLDFPAIQDIARLTFDNVANSDVRRGDIETNESVSWADPDFFTVIPLPIVAGDLQAALHQADGIAISRKIARKYFGRDDPIGETLELGRKNVMKVLAVFEDLPMNSHLSFDVVGSGLASFSKLAYMDAHPQGGVSSYTYFRLAPGGSIQKMRDGMPDFFRRHMRAASENSASKVELRLTPLPDIHLSPGNFATMKPRGNLSVIYGVSAVGILIIVIAIINFVNVMTARAARRAIEVGVRKVTGADRRHLILQFIGEAFIYVFAAVILALALTALVLPKLNAFLERSISFTFWRDPILAAGLLCGAVIVAVLAGGYPAFVLSQFRPATVLKAGDVGSPGSSFIRQILVVTQFAILIGLMVATGVIYRQTSYAFNESMRLDRDQVLVVFGSCKTAFKDEIAKLPGVRATACASDTALNAGGSNGVLRGPDGRAVSLNVASVGFGFFDFYDFKPIAGRFFDESRASDILPRWTDADATRDGKDASQEETTHVDASAVRPAAVVLNETAVRRLGFASPEDAVGKFLDTTHSGLGANLGPRDARGNARDEIIAQAEIIGVAPDFALDTIHAPMVPAIYFVNPNRNGYLNVRLTGREIPETLAAIDRLWQKLGDPRPISRSFLEQRVEALYMDVTRQSQIFQFFAGIALFVACLGLFGLSAFTAERRTKEIGVRKALGANRVDILRLLLWEFAKPVLWANAIAWPVGYVVMHRWLEGFAYHVNLGPWVFLGASALALAIAVLTVAGHALLVARSQPATALRYE